MKRSWIIKSMLAVAMIFSILTSNFVLAEDVNTDNKNIKPSFFNYPIVNLDVKTNKNNYFIGENVEITIENNGDKPVYFSGPTYHWTIERFVDGVWNKVYPGLYEITVFIKTELGPGEKEIDIWDQTVNLIIGSDECAKIKSGYYRVVVKYRTNEEYNKENPCFTKYSYFAIDNIYIEPAKLPIISVHVEKIENPINLTVKPPINSDLQIESIKTPIKELEAVEISKEEANLISIKSVELQENEKCYKITGTKEGRLFWFIPTKMDVTVYVSADEGQITKIEKPWWS